VLLAIDEDEEAVDIEASDVAGADEAPAPGIVPRRLRREVGAPMVTRHHRGRVADDLARAAARELAAVLVDDADVVARRGLPDGMQLPAIDMRQQDAGAATLRHAVELDETSGPAREHVALELRREGRAGGELREERREVVASEIRALH